MDPRFPEWCGATNFGGKCPVQGEGKIGDAYWYFRARGARWSITVATTEDEAVWPREGEPLYHHEEPFGEWPEAGWMSDEMAIAFIVRELGKYREGRKLG